MHEFSLAQGLLRQLHDLAAENNAKRIITVKVEIGPQAGIVVDSFEFGFSVLAAESPLTQAATLKVSTPAAIYKCMTCGYIIKQDNKPTATCPACQGKTLLPEGGSDIILLQVEMDTVEPETNTKHKTESKK